MLSIDDALARILARLRPLPAEIVGLADGWGRVCAGPLVSRLDNPPADISAMDGYAVRGDDTSSLPELSVIGEAPAGRPFSGAVTAGTCVRLFTGSVMPDGSDSVLIQEHATRSGTVLRVDEPVAAGRHIRRQGQDFSVGDVVVAAGRRLGARDIGVAAAANHAWVPVHRRPRIALLATGDELSLPGDPVSPGGVVNSNTPMLAALVRAAGAIPMMLPLAGDTVAAIEAATAGLGAGGADMLVTIGGASVGDYDLVQAGLASLGLELDFWKIAMRPGKPLMHGRLLGAGLGLPVLGLPGNPVSALVCALRFLLPAIRRLSGEPDAALDTETAVLGRALPDNDHRADHLRAALERDAAGDWVATPFDRQDSGMLRRLAACEALILRAPHAPAQAVGGAVRILRLDRFGI